jgi:LacI family transcriptional regulator
MALIERLAQEFSVSNATISRALNDKPGVSKELRERILARAREIEHAPNFAARSLASARTFNIGYFVREKPNLLLQQDPFYYEIQHGIEAITARSDYHLSVATLTENYLRRPQDFRLVGERRIDAMILAGPDIPSDFIMAMIKTNLPVVIVDNRLTHTPVNCVNCDDEGGAYRAAQHLIELGHRQIGVIAGPLEWASSARRVRGYTRAAHEAGALLYLLHEHETTLESGQRALSRLHLQHPDITAVCAVNDAMAIGAVRAAVQMGLRVPEDLSVIGFDNIAWAAMNHPALTTMNIPKIQMGKEAAMRLLTLLEETDLLPSEIIVPVQLVERQSTAPKKEVNSR